jgi:hypothetical protein
MKPVCFCGSIFVTKKNGNDDQKDQETKDAQIKQQIIQSLLFDVILVQQTNKILLCILVYNWHL